MMNSEEIDLLAGSKAEAEAETRGKSTLAENTWGFNGKRLNSVVKFKKHCQGSEGQ